MILLHILGWLFLAWAGFALIACIICKVAGIKFKRNNEYVGYFCLYPVLVLLPRTKIQMEYPEHLTSKR